MITFHIASENMQHYKKAVPVITFHITSCNLELKISNIDKAEVGPSITFHLTTEIMQHFDKAEVEPSITFHITTENMYATLSKGAVTSFYLWKVFQKNII